ncbi:MAG: cyclic nucleotide-binding domain-containing protein [Devosia sp.]
MIGSLEKLFSELSDPVILFGHFTYALLIVSTLMRRMVWLRGFAVASGIAKVIYRAFFVLDPVSVLWETLFVLVNIVQLLIIWYYEHHHRFGDDQRHFVDSMPAGVERSAIKRLLDLSELMPFAPGDTLTQQGQPVTQLMYLADGIVKIEQEGRIVAICGPGDYIGELSFLTGSPATATAEVVKPARVLAFDQTRLRASIDADPALRRALESALNRNLAGKLVRSNAPKSDAADALAP